MEVIMNSKNKIKVLMVCIVIDCLNLESVYANAVYPNSYKPTLPYMLALFASLTSLIIFCFILLMVIYRNYKR